MKSDKNTPILNSKKSNGKNVWPAANAIALCAVRSNGSLDCECCWSSTVIILNLKMTMNHCVREHDS